MVSSGVASSSRRLPALPEPVNTARLPPEMTSSLAPDALEMTRAEGV